MLLSILQCTGQYPQKRIICPQMLLVMRYTALIPSLVHLPSSQTSDPRLWRRCGYQKPSQLDVKLKQLEFMEQQGTEYSRVGSEVKTGSKIKWILTESYVKLEISTEISKCNKCCIKKGALYYMKCFKILS